MGNEYASYQAYLQALLDPDTEADFATVIGLRILTQVYIFPLIPIPIIPLINFSLVINSILINFNKNNCNKF